MHGFFRKRTQSIVNLEHGNDCVNKIDEDDIVILDDTSTEISTEKGPGQSKSSTNRIFTTKSKIRPIKNKSTSKTTETSGTLTQSTFKKSKQSENIAVDIVDEFKNINSIIDRQTFFDKPLIYVSRKQKFRLVEFTKVEHIGYIVPSLGILDIDEYYSNSMPTRVIIKGASTTVPYNYDGMIFIPPKNKPTINLFVCRLLDSLIDIPRITIPPPLPKIPSNFQVLVIHGPTGSGKTSLCNSIKDCNSTYRITSDPNTLIHELNTSNKRNFKSLIALKNHKIVLLDDVDILFTTDDLFWRGVEELSRYCRVIMTATNLPPLQKLDLESKIKFLWTGSFVNNTDDYIYRCGIDNGYLLHRDVVHFLGKHRERDIRGSINNLDFYFPLIKVCGASKLVVNMTQSKPLIDDVFQVAELNSSLDIISTGLGCDEVEYDDDLVLHLPIVNLNYHPQYSKTTELLQDCIDEYHDFQDNHTCNVFGGVDVGITPLYDQNSMNDRHDIHDDDCIDMIEIKSFKQCYDTMHLDYTGSTFYEYFSWLMCLCKMFDYYGVDERRGSRRRRKLYPVDLGYEFYEFLIAYSLS